ncbi:MAG TPA: GNAT family N-acetyltransferase [Gaiellaceae bacterium]|nr:GNAT family N-acetyltransferase [Gaiellaceae bacterium]
MELESVVVGSSEVAIRDLDESRLEAAVKLWESSESNDAFAFSLAETLAAVVAGEPALVALSGDRVIGASAARADGGRAWILRWSVEADSRRRGIGASLLRRVRSTSPPPTSSSRRRRRRRPLSRGRCAADSHRRRRRTSLRR